MEIKELVSFYINETKEILEVAFKLTTDGDDDIREDKIEFDELRNFGYDFLIEDFDEFSDFEDEDEGFDDEFNPEIDDEEIISFLNEYYLIFPDKLPNSELY